MRKGQVNRLIDAVVHPYFKRHPVLVVVDGVLHAVVEQDPLLSAKKWIRYGLPKLLVRCR